MQENQLLDLSFAPGLNKSENQSKNLHAQTRILESITGTPGQVYTQVQQVLKN